MNEYIGFKIQLFPTQEQKDLLNKYFGACRFTYNWAIDKEKESYEEDNIFLSKYSLNNEYTKFKKDNEWLLDFDSTSLKIVLFDVVHAFKEFFKKRNRFPKYKSKKSVYKMTPIRSDRITICDNYVKFPKSIGVIKCGRLPNTNIKGIGYKTPSNEFKYKNFYNGRIIFDGYKYWFTFNMKIDDNINFASVYKFKNVDQKMDSIIGIDLGCKGKNWIVDSNNNIVNLPDSSKEDKRLLKLRKKLNRQYEVSRTKACKRSKNREKTIAKINKLEKRKTNKKKNAVHEYVNKNILSIKPSTIVLEDLKVSDMLKTKNNSIIPKKSREIYNRKVLDSCLTIVQNIIEYKCKANGIQVIKADQHFASTQRCSSCGSIQKIGSRSKYKCPVCGMIRDRDLNAAINLSLYPKISINL